MDGMAAMDRLEDSISIASQTLQLKEFLLEKANITDDDLDYFFNYTVVLVQKTDMSTLATIPGLESDDSTSDEPDTVDGSYTGCGMGLHKPSVHLVHGILSLIICLAGCLANIVNIVVLSRRELRRNAINRILCSLAVADFLLMLEYIPFACHMYLFPGRSLQTRYSYPWAVFVLFHAHFTLVAHTVSIWLTLSLAFWRYEVLKNGRHQRRKNGRRCHQERCTRTIAMAYIGSVLLCIPSFITFGIQSEPIKNTNFTINHTQLPTASSWSSSSAPLQLPEAVIYKVDLNRIAKNHDGIIHKAHLWAYSVVMKLGPCLVLTVLTCWLVRRLWEAERHHQSLTAKLNEDSRNHHHQEVVEQQQQHQGAATATLPKPVTPLLRAHHHENINQISLTQQLEMRQLNSVMNRDSGVQIIVTEAAVADTIEPLADTPAVGKRSSVTTVTFGSGDTGQIRQTELVIPARNRRKLSVVEFSSVVMSTSCYDRDDGGLKLDGESHAMTTVEAEGGTVLEVSAPSRSQVTTLNSTKSLRHKHQTDRTTRMLVAVLVLFLVTEIPQGVMALLSGVLGRQFFIKCYSTGMGEILDLLALLNSAINFLLYCSMSRQFRRAARSQFRRLFGMMTGGNDCHGGSPADCFFRPKLLTQPQPINISPSIPTRCTQL